MFTKMLQQPDTFELETLKIAHLGQKQRNT